PQAKCKQGSRFGEFPPPLSTAVEGSCKGGKSLQKAYVCSVLAGWYARRSLRVRGRGAGVGVEHQIELTAESLWGEVAGRLRGALNDTTYGTWFGEAQGLELGDERFVLA